MDLKWIRQCFDVDSTYGWIAPLIIPIILWWVSINQALHDNGLIGKLDTHPAVLTAIYEYAKTMSDFPGEPAISLHVKRKANTEARLVVRTLNDEDLLDSPLQAFVFPACMSILIAFWSVAFAWRFTLAPAHKLRDVADHVLVVGNIGALVWYFGFTALLEAAK